jgi:hypothetical protein
VLQVLGTVKNTGLVVFCVVFLNEIVTFLQSLGYTLALAGFGWYQYIKTRQVIAVEEALSLSAEDAKASALESFVTKGADDPDRTLSSALSNRVHAKAEL